MMAWMVNELFGEGGRDLSIRVTPGVGGILQVFVDGEKIFDKADEGGKFPDLSRVREMRAVVRQKLDAVPVAAGAD